MLAVYQDILDLRFEEIKDGPSWHQDVRMFSVYDRPSNSFMGHFYLGIETYLLALPQLTLKTHRSVATRGQVFTCGRVSARPFAPLFYEIVSRHSSFIFFITPSPLRYHSGYLLHFD